MDTNASTLTADDFIHNLQDSSGITIVVELERYSTQGLVDKAKKILSKFAQDEKRVEQYPSSLPTLNSIDPHPVLVAMLDCAPNERGTRYVAAAIISYARETHELVDLANTWIRYLLLPCEPILYSILDRVCAILLGLQLKEIGALATILPATTRLQC